MFCIGCDNAVPYSYRYFLSQLEVMKMRKIIFLLLIVLNLVTQVSASGGEELGLPSLSLEQILLVCLVACIILALILHKFFKIRDRDLLIFAVIVSVTLLVIDYLYQKYVFYS